MSIFEHHIFICTNEREESDPRGCCSLRGSEKVLETFRLELKERGLKATIRANKAGCLDQCALGPVVVIYPSGTWYCKVQPTDVPDILNGLAVNRPVQRLLHPRQNSE